MFLAMFFILRATFRVLTCLIPLQIFGNINLEEKCQDFVLETKRIIIPSFPFAFNPGITHWRGQLLMTFRDIPDPKQSFTSHIWIVQIDETFQPVSEPQLLELLPPGASPEIPSRAEDARLITVGEDLYIVYSDNRDALITKGGFRVYIARLEHDGSKFVAKSIDALKRYPGESLLVREKNWVPFVYQNELLLAYSVDPHLIFRSLPGMEACETFSQFSNHISWKWGILRGGTPALNIDGHQYLAFFHSSIKMKTMHSNEKEILHYFVGAYTFSLEPPFEITQISPEPIVGKGFYIGEVYKPYWGSIRTVFPGGYIFNDDFIWVLYGRQDHEMWVAKLDRHGLFKSLVPVPYPIN